MVGIAQMTMLIPTMLLILVGGSLADIFGGRRIVIVAQSVAALPPLFLCIVVLTGNLSFKAMIYYAIIMGTAQAFVTPARDGLLNQVAEGGIQTRGGARQHDAVRRAARRVSRIASLAERVGPLPILLVQALVLTLGVRFFARIPDRPTPVHQEHHRLRDIGRSIAEGYRTIAASPSMRMTVLQSVAMGTCFMGSYIVTLPLLVREYYAGSARRPRVDECGERIGAGHDDLHADPLRRHPPAGSRAVARARARRRDARHDRHRRQLHGVAGADLSVGNGRRHRDEHGAHDHAGGGDRRTSAAA